LHGFSGPDGLKYGFGGQNGGRDGAMLTPMNSFLLLGVLTSVQIFMQTDQEMRPWKCTLTDTQIYWQMQTSIIICPMLYAIAMGQIMSTSCKTNLLNERPHFLITVANL